MRSFEVMPKNSDCKEISRKAAKTQSFVPVFFGLCGFAALREISSFQ